MDSIESQILTEVADSLKSNPPIKPLPSDDPVAIVADFTDQIAIRLKTNPIENPKVTIEEAGQTLILVSPYGARHTMPTMMSEDDRNWVKAAVEFFNKTYETTNG